MARDGCVLRSFGSQVCAADEQARGSGLLRVCSQGRTACCAIWGQQNSTFEWCGERGSVKGRERRDRIEE